MLFRRQRAPDPTGHTGDERSCRHHGPFEDDRAGRDERPGADDRPVEDCRVHPDQAVVLDRAPVDDRGVTLLNGDVRSYDSLPNFSEARFPTVRKLA